MTSDHTGRAGRHDPVTTAGCWSAVNPAGCAGFPPENSAQGQDPGMSGYAEARREHFGLPDESSTVAATGAAGTNAAARAMSPPTSSSRSTGGSARIAVNHPLVARPAPRTSARAALDTSPARHRPSCRGPCPDPPRSATGSPTSRSLDEHTLSSTGHLRARPLVPPRTVGLDRAGARRRRQPRHGHRRTGGLTLPRPWPEFPPRTINDEERTRSDQYPKGRYRSRPPA